MIAKPAQRLLIVGDSISLGASEVRINEIVGRVDRSYVDLLREHFTGIELLIDADVHRTTGLALRMIDSLLETHRPHMVLLLLGGNDADVEWKRFVISDGRVLRNRVTLEDFAQNLRTLVQKIGHTGAIPILTDMPRHCLELRGPHLSTLSGKDVVSMIARQGGQTRSDAIHDQYQRAAEQIANEMGCPFAGFSRQLQQQPLRNLSGSDGVHPNQLAHEIIAMSLTPILEQLIHQRPTRLMGAGA